MILGIPPETWEDILEIQKWLFENKIDNWGWHTLSLSGNPRKFDKSEFEKDPTKYGFTFPNPDDFNEWEHKSGVTKKQVDKWYVDVRTLWPLPPNPGAWETIELLNYFNKDSALTPGFYSSFYEETKYNRSAWTALYFKMLQDLPDAD